MVPTSRTGHGVGNLFRRYIKCAGGPPLCVTVSSLHAMGQEASSTRYVQRTIRPGFFSVIEKTIRRRTWIKTMEILRKTSPGSLTGLCQGREFPQVLPYMLSVRPCASSFDQAVTISPPTAVIYNSGTFKAERLTDHITSSSCSETGLSMFARTHPSQTEMTRKRQSRITITTLFPPIPSRRSAPIFLCTCSNTRTTQMSSLSCTGRSQRSCVGGLKPAV